MYGGINGGLLRGIADGDVLKECHAEFHRAHQQIQNDDQADGHLHETLGALVFFRLLNKIFLHDLHNVPDLWKVAGAVWRGEDYLHTDAGWVVLREGHREIAAPGIECASTGNVRTEIFWKRTQSQCRIGYGDSVQMEIAVPITTARPRNDHS